MSEDDITCLVIGANGFIGSHLVDELALAGYKVLALDRYGSARQFSKYDNVTQITDDLSTLTKLKKALVGVDYVFHSVSASTPFTSDNDPYTDIDLNLRRNVGIFELCAKANIKKLIYISSGGAIYGHIAERKYVTEEDPTMPVSPYGICKLASENYLAYFELTAGLQYCALRLTNPYGPRQRARNNQGVIPTFLDKIYDGRPLEVYGDGSSSRDYIYIKDVTTMIVRTFRCKMKHSTYNLGSGEQTSLKQIIDILEELFSKEVPVNYKEALKTFLTSSKVNIDRFTNEFGIKPSYSLKKGLRQMIAEQNS